MDNEFLQSFLKTGLFEIGDRDDRLDKLRKSIEELQKKFEEDYSLLPKYTLVAIDPNISDKEPSLITTEKIVIKYWETLRSKYPEMPRNILRGVVLNALNNVGINEPIAARIIYLSALNLYPYVKLNKEKKIVEAMLIHLGEIAEKNAIEEWSLIENEPTLKLGMLKLKSVKLESVSIDSGDLQPKLRIAIDNAPSGHTAQNHGGSSEWGEHFANNASEGISTAFNGAIAKLTESFSSDSIIIPINKFFTEFKKNLNSNLKSSFSSLTAVERRSKLLWWKETLYSPSLKRSYRGLDNNLLPIIMGVDLNNQIPEITPISVDYLLRETLFLLNDKKDEPIELGEFLKKISESSIKKILKPIFTNLNEDEGRITITDFISLFVNDRIYMKDFQSKTGIKEKDESNISEIAVAILHDLLTQRLIEE